MSRYKVTLVEPHRVKSVWKREGVDRIMGSVRTRTPLHTQPILAGALEQQLGDDYAIDIVDSRLIDTDREELYKVVPYGGGTLEHYRVGMDLAGDRFVDLAKTTDLLGLTVNFTQEAGIAMDIARRAKELNPELNVVYGGSDVRARAGDYLRAGSADAVVIGDGERCGAPLIRTLLEGGDLRSVPSVAFLEDGKVRPGCSPMRDTVPMEEVALPAFHRVRNDIPKWTESHEGDLPQGVNPPLAYVETSRGCHETCPFCYSAGLKYRFMHSEQIEGYCRHLRDYGIKAIMMIADNELTPLLIRQIRGLGMSGRDLLIERYRIFQRSGLTWEFSNGLQYSMFMQNGKLDEELIEEMFSNCYRLFTPVEDPLDLVYDKLYGSPAERKHSAKGVEEAFEEHHIKVLARIAATGLPMMTFGLIIGWPGDTVERVRRVGEQCKRLRAAILEANPNCQLLFTPFVGIPIPGTQTWVDYQRQGAIQEDVLRHPEAWQFALTTYGNFEMIDARLELISELDGQTAMEEWTATGAYPHQVA